MFTENQQFSKAEEIIEGLRPIDDTLFRIMFLKSPLKQIPIFHPVNKKTLLFFTPL